MIIVGHRGARGEAPENTLSGIQYCFDISIYDFEVDIRLSSDDSFVLMHDASLERTCARKQMLHQTTAKKLSSIYANQDTKADYFSNEFWQEENEDNCIPTLNELLSLAENSAQNNQRCSFQLEIKSDEHTNSTAIITKITREFSPSRMEKLACDITFTSFDREIISGVREQAPHLNCGIVADETAIDAIQLATELKCTHCCLNYSLMLNASNTLKEQIQESELHISVWTLNKIELISELEQLGVSSIITDYPSQFI